MSTIRAYESTNGDTWDLVRDDVTKEIHVRHTPNGASGGAVSEMALPDFMRFEPWSPQHHAVAELAGKETRDGTFAPQVTGYVHDPKQEGGPYIAVVLRPGGEPSVTLHRSHEEADRELRSRLSDLRQMSINRLRGDEIAKHVTPQRS